MVSVIEKYAFGIATMLASWSDIALADEGAQFGYPEVQHGITPYGAVPTMLNTMSQKAMLDLLLTGRRIGAAEAVRLSIITRAVAADRLEAERDQVCGDLFAAAQRPSAGPSSSSGSARRFPTATGWRPRPTSTFSASACPKCAKGSLRSWTSGRQIGRRLTWAPSPREQAIQAFDREAVFVHGRAGGRECGV